MLVRVVDALDELDMSRMVSGYVEVPGRGALYYYAQNDCTSCDLFLIKLDPKLNDTQKAIYANIVQRVEEPIISTKKNAPA